LVAADRWCSALEAEIALAAGNLDAAEESFGEIEPHVNSLAELPITREMFDWFAFNNNFPLRDGLARVAKAKGDLDEAIDMYRRLNTPSIDSKWMSVLEPRYVFEVARLLDEIGDQAAAREEYERFLDLWKDADPDLPELDEARTRLGQLEARRP
jgi:tetratricopeptide (TPR) repeat protein